MGGFDSYDLDMNRCDFPLSKLTNIKKLSMKTFSE